VTADAEILVVNLVVFVDLHPGFVVVSHGLDLVLVRLLERRVELQFELCRRVQPEILLVRHHTCCERVLEFERVVALLRWPSWLQLCLLLF
jgi:hypothetical protein